MYYVYILYSVEKNRLYTGQTQDYLKRLERHNAGREKSTKPFIPWTLAILITLDSRSDAMRLEKKIKLFKKRSSMIAFAFKSGGVAGPGWSEALLQKTNRGSTEL